MADVSRNLSDYVKGLKQLIELMAASQARMLVALAKHGDTAAVLAEAEGGGKPS